MTRTILLLAAAASLLAAGCAYSPGATAPSPRQMQVNDTRLTYVEQGSGTPVVFVHGAFGDWRNWDAMSPAIAAKYRFVALSLRYHYPNEWADDGAKYSLAQHAEDVAAFIRGLNAGKVHLAGNSMGSRVIASLAVKYPELVRSLVLGEPFLVPPGSDAGKAAVAEFQKDAALSSTAAKAGDLPASARLLYNAVNGSASAFDQASGTSRQRVLDNAPSMGPYWRQPAAAPITCDQLKALPMPVLVVSAADTRPIFRYGAETLMACLPGTATRSVIADARHTWFGERPEEGAKLILAFLESK